MQTRSFLISTVVGLILSGLSLTGPRFDIDADDFYERTGWIGAGEGFLARDTNADGIINNVSELFGTSTTSGFTALSELDDVANGGNADGMIDANDAGFADLLVWVDANSDGITDGDELKTLAELDIESFSLTTQAPVPGEENINGNTITALSEFRRGDGTTGALADVALVYETVGSVNSDGSGGSDGGGGGSGEEDPDGASAGFDFDGLTFYGGVDAGGGDDEIEPGAVDTLIIGGAGHDKVDYSTKANSKGLEITSKLGSGGMSPIGAETGNATNVGAWRLDVAKQVDGADAAIDAIYQVEEIIATELDDTVVFEALPDAELMIDAGAQSSKGGDELSFSLLDTGVKFKNNKIDGTETEFKNFETIVGTQFNDELVLDSVPPSDVAITIIGGTGRDFIFNTSTGGEIYGDTIDGRDPNGGALTPGDQANSDLFWWWPGTTIKDPGPEDHLQFFGVPLTGGTNSVPMVAFGGAAGIFAAPQLALKTANSPLFTDQFMPFINYLAIDDRVYVVNSFQNLIKVFGDYDFSHTSDGINLQGGMALENFNPAVSYWGMALSAFTGLGGRGDLGMIFKKANPLLGALAWLPPLPGAFSFAYYGACR